jgi:anti-anti-sigma factor
MDLDLSLDTSSGGPMLALSGRLTGATAALLESWLAEHAPAPLMWDMRNLTFVSSAGLRVLLMHEKRVRQRGAATVLVGVNPTVREVLRITGLATFWQQVDEPPPQSPMSGGPAGSTSGTVGTAAGTAAGTAPSPPGTMHGRDGSLFVSVRHEAAAGTLVRWTSAPEGAPWPGASLRELALSFGRGGIGARHDEAAQRPLAFAATLRALSLRLDDGETDTLPVADPDGTYVRIAEAWSLVGAPSTTVRALDPTSDTVLGEIVRATTGASWNGVLCLLPSGGADRIVLGVLPPGTTIAWVAVTLPVRDLPISDAPAFEALRDLLPESVGDRLDDGMPAQLPAGTIIYCWPQDQPQEAGERTLKIDAPDGMAGAGDETELIVRTLYADCRRVTLTALTGGFSAATWQVESVDAQGRLLLPTVLKVGPAHMMTREHAAHERYVRPFILNNASVGLGTAAQGDRVGLRYNFLGVTGERAELRTLARRWRDEPAERMHALYDTVARRTLLPWYGQARERDAQLYVDHTPLRLFPTLQAVAREVLEFDLDGPTIDCAPLGRAVPNPWWFLAHEFPARAAQTTRCRVAITHGDLNLNNVLSDERDNLYVIDFSETMERSVGSDFARLEPVFLIEQGILENEADERRLLQEAEALYSGDAPWDMVPAALADGTPRLAFIAQLRRLARHYLGNEAAAETYLLPVLEWTLPIVLYSNLSLRRRRISTWVAALQVERLLRPGGQ